MELHLTNLVSDQLIKALCNTLIHSLWQGLILAAITGLTVVLTKRATAALRYNLMIGFLILFSVGTTFTFIRQLDFSEQKGAVSIHATTKAQLLQVATNNVQIAEKPDNMLGNCIAYFNTHADMIVLIWFLIICARCIQLAAGLYTIYHIRRTKVLSAGTYWDNKIAELSNHMGIKRAVHIMQSGIAKLPLVLGHFKPVILIPIGLLTALSTEEVESILVHELAHIHRRDYLVNLLQNLIEIVFFFNPAVLWVSALIKAERENCCDDMVVMQTNSKISYIKALVSCHEYQSVTPAYAMGLGGQNDHFLQRVKRILSNRNQTLNRVEKMVLTICLISAVLLTAAFSRTGKEHDVIQPKSVKSYIPAIKVTKTDSLTNTKIKGDTGTYGYGKLKIYKNSEVADGSVIRFTKKIKHELYITYLVKKNGVLYQYTGLENGNKSTYYVNGKPVSNDKMAEYHDFFERMMSEADMSAPQSPARPGTPQHNGEIGEITGHADSVKAKADVTGVSPRLTTRQALDSLKLANGGKWRLKANKLRLNTPLTRLDTERAIAAYKMAAMDSTRRQAWQKTSKGTVTPKAYPYSYPAYQSPYGPAKPIVSGSLTPSKPYVSGSLTPAKPMVPPSPLPNIGDEISEQLIKDHLIKNKDHYSFKITNDELYIDGVKQPDDIHQQIMSKYFKEGDKINYTRTNTTNN